MTAAPDDPLVAARAERLTLAGLALQTTLAGIALAVAFASGSFAALGVAVHLGAGALAWGAGAVVAARRRRFSVEVAEESRLAEAAVSEGRRPLFARKAAGAEATREERLSAILALGLALVELGLAGGLVYLGLSRPETATVGRLLGSSATLAGSAFGLLLLAQYALGLAGSLRGSPLGLAAGGARRAASGAIVALAGAVALALVSLQARDAGTAEELRAALTLDSLGYAVAGLEGVLGLELVLGLVLELYRPRRRGEVPRPAFESRLLSLVAEPTGIARSLARALDYQFGFQLSETWAYQLVERGVAPLLLFLGLAFWSLSALVIVPQGERAILEHLGAARLPALEPGLHAKLPWPIETVERVPTARVRQVVLGPEADDDDEHHEKDRETRRHPAILWTRGHAKDEFHILVARPAAAGETRDAPVDLLAARVPVSFVVSDPAVFARGAQEPERLLKALGERELAVLGCSRDLFALLGPGRADAARDLRDRIQKSADERALGVTILDVNLADLHPPADLDVAAAFHAETRAFEEREARRLEGAAYAAGSRPDARGKARQILERARSDAARRRLLAQADASRFGALLALDKAAPRVFRTLRLLRGLEEALSTSARKVVVPRGTQPSAIDLDLGEKLHADDLGAPEPSAPTTEAPPPGAKDK